jgi:hypothetical protein
MLALIKEGVTNPVGATYEQFISDDFDGTFDRIRKPAPEFKDFLNDMKKRAKEADTGDEHPYG